MKAPGRLEIVPMLRLVPALVAGILAGRYLDGHWQFWALGSLAAGLGGFGLMFGRLHQFRYIYISGALLLMALFLGGAALYQQGKPDTELSATSACYSGEVHRIIREDSLRTRAVILLTDAEYLRIAKPLQILASFDNEGKSLLPGDRVHFMARVVPIASPANPGQFDLASYYGHKWIRYQTWVPASSWVLEPTATKFSWRNSSYLLSRSARDRMKEYLQPEVAATLQAILLGVKHEISREMLATYQNAGVMHILAVSGMHVMIIYLGLRWLIQLLKRKERYFSWLPIVLIWIFAFVTGSGAAVLRASFMLTLFDLGARTGNQRNNINVLFSAALLLLLLQPYLLWDIGFQLSYAAMGGIFLFFKPLSDLVHIETPLTRKLLWSPSVLSVSAQLGTMPLTLHYFGTFPVYFILSNILVLIPVMFIMYAGIAWLLLSLFLPAEAIAYIAKGLGVLIQYGFNYPLVWLESLPYSYLRNLHVEPFQVVLLIVSILLFALWIHDLRNGKWLLRCMFMLLPVIVWSNYRYWKHSLSPSIIVPEVKGHQAVAAGYAGKAYLWTDSILMSNPSKADFSLSGILKVFPWKKWSWLPDQSIMADGAVMVAAGTSFFRVDQSLYRYHAEQPVPIDVLFLTEQVYLDTARFKRLFDPGLVVLTGDLSHRKRQLFSRLLTESGFPVHDLSEWGALVISGENKSVQLRRGQ